MYPTASRIPCGFSLIELTVVLLLVSMATAFVIPNLSSVYQNMTARTELDEILIRISSLSKSTHYRGQAMSIVSADQARDLLEVGDEWQIEVVEPIHVLHSGVCKGGLINFSRGDFEESVRFLAPYCHRETSN